MKCLGKLVIIDALCPQFKEKTQTNRIQTKDHTNFFIVTLVCIIWNVFPPIEPKHLLYFCVGRFYALTYYNMWKKFERYNDFYDEILFGDAILWCVTLMFFDTLIEIIDNKSELIKKNYVMKRVLTNSTNPKNCPGKFCDANKFICIAQCAVFEQRTEIWTLLQILR